MTAHKINIEMHRERYNQLRALNRAFGADENASVVQAIRNVFIWAADQGLVEHKIPGVEINTLDDGIAIAFGAALPTAFTFEGALALAETIKSFVAKTNKEKRVTDLINRFAVHHVGPAIAIYVDDLERPARTWPADLAEDFAILIEKAVATK